MSNKTKTYATHCLAASGFAVMSSVVAYRLRPDLWASGQECAFDFRGRDLRIEGTGRMIVTIPGVGQAPILTRSTDMLEKRIEWVTGFKVEKIEDETLPGIDQAPRARSEAQRVAEVKEAELRALANQEPPAHDCHLRREILAARAQIERIAA